MNSAVRKLPRLAAAAVVALLLCAVPARSSVDPIPLDPIVSEWAGEGVARAAALGLIPQYEAGWPNDYRQPVSRDMFRRAAMELVACQMNCGYEYLISLTGQYKVQRDADGHIIAPFTDGGPGIDEAYYLGVVKGRGNGMFAPGEPITRQEAAALLVQTYAAYSGEAPTGSGMLGYSDAPRIAPWARESVLAVTAWGVMEGLEDGSFAPEEYYTVEQCLVTLVRLYERAPVTRAKGAVINPFAGEQGVRGWLSEEDGVRYVDERLGFAMELPESWRGKLEVEPEYDLDHRGGGHCITFYHRPTREACNGGVLFYIDCYPGSRTEDDPPVMAGSSVSVLQTDQYTFFFRTPGDVQWHERDEALELEYKAFMAEFEYVRAHIKPIE